MEEVQACLVAAVGGDQGKDDEARKAGKEETLHPLLHLQSTSVTTDHVLRARSHLLGNQLYPLKVRIVVNGE